MSDLQAAAAQARDFLAVYSPYKPPRFAAGGADVLQPERTIRQALEEAQFILLETSRAAFQTRIRSLASVRRWQRVINSLHLLTGSGFVLLIADKFSGPTKWLGALVSLGAGILALFLPGDVRSVESEIFNDAAAASQLSGEITKIQTRLLFKTVADDPSLAADISAAVGKATELATK